MYMAITMYILFFTLINLFFLPTQITAHTNNITAVYAFGDSILDPGNNNHLHTIFKADHQPYGREFPGRVPSGRFSDGKLTTDFLVSKLGLKELLPAYLDRVVIDEALLTGASFASAGSGLDKNTVRTAHVLGMSEQLEYFKRALKRMKRSVGSKEAGRVVENALFIFGAGTNDMLYSFYKHPSNRRRYGLSGYQDKLLKDLEFNIRELHKNGARRIGVMGLPPIGCLPEQVTLESLIPSFHWFQRLCVDQKNKDSQAYNAKLRAMISNMQQTLHGSKIVYVDIYTPLMDMMTNPKAYGFESTREGCCGVSSLEVGPLCNSICPTCQDPSKYIFWDAVHPTQAANFNLANHFYKNVLPSFLS